MTVTTPSPGRWRRFVHGMVATEREVEAAALQVSTRRRGGTPVAQAIRGEHVTFVGTLRSVTLRPRSGVAALEAELYDGTGVAVLVWLGRRRIRGIEPGRTLAAFGRLTMRGDDAILFNPRYELLPQAGT